MLIGCFCFLAGAQILSTSATYDEPSYLAAGYTYLVGHDYRMYAPPLAVKIDALPLLFLPKFDRRFQPDRIFRERSQAAYLALVSWVDLISNPFAGAQYPFSHLFLYAPSDDAVARLHAGKLVAISPTDRLTKADFITDGDLLLRAARFTSLVFPVALALFIFCWSFDLWGLGGAILSLAFYCFNPNIIAHGALATTDVPFACLFFSTVYFFVRLTRRFSAGNFAGLLLSFGLAQTVKHSGLMLFPVMMLLLAMQALRKPGWPFVSLRKVSLPIARLIPAAAIFGALAIAGLVCIWWQYDFRFDVSPDANKTVRQILDIHPQLASSGGAGAHLPVEMVLRLTEGAARLQKVYPQGDADFSKQPLNSSEPYKEQTLLAFLPAHPQSVESKLALFINNHHILPEAYTYGLTLIKEQAIGREAYLYGQTSTTGFSSYFLHAFWLKNPLIFLAALAGAVVLLLRRRRCSVFELCCLSLPILFYGAIAVLSGYNIGIRHALPMFPFLFVMIGVLSQLKLPGMVNRTVLLCATVAAVALNSSVVFTALPRPQIVYPDYLTYFNECAGGPTNGWRALLDSNLDWGQGLKPLSTWLKDRHIFEPIYLCYWGQADPLFEGISYRPVIGCMSYYGKPVNFDDIKPGSYFTISANLVPGLGLNPRFGPRVQQFLNERCVLVDQVDHSMFVYRVER